MTEPSFSACVADAMRLRQLAARWLPILELHLGEPLPALERAHLWRELKAAQEGRLTEAIPYPDATLVVEAVEAVAVMGRWHDVLRCTATGYLVRGEGDGMIDEIPRTAVEQIRLGLRSGTTRR